MPKLTVDGKEVEFEPGTTVIQAAARAGITVPNYCWHPGLSVAGNCRICLVEIEKMPKLAIACSTAAADGMVVRTVGERVREARDAIMEFLLINHPLDCPICDQAGECRLQEYSYRYGSGESRFVEEKVHKPKRVDLGPHVVFDAERCILCTRCVRFCDEVTGTGELTVAMRGDHATIATFPGRSLDNPYSGNTVDICPVGALTLREFRFKTRVWFLRNTSSVCPGCARGCSITIGSRDTAGARDAGGRDHRIHRFVPRENRSVNGWWMCDDGRLSYRKLSGSARLAHPWLPPPATGAGAAGTGGPGGRAAWPEALDAAARLLRDAAQGRDAGAVALLVSPRASNEDLAAAALLARAANLRSFLAAHEQGENDDLLIRSDKSPNRRGAQEIFAGLDGSSGARPGFAGDAGALSEEIAAGRVRGLLMMGHTLMGFEEDRPMPPEDLRRLEALVLIDAFDTAAVPAAGVVLPALAYGEFEGTFTNFEGQVQRVRAPLPPHGYAWPAWRILQELGARLAGEGAEFPRFDGPRAIFELLTRRVPAFAPLGWAALGESGGRLAGADGPRGSGGS